MVAEIINILGRYAQRSMIDLRGNAILYTYGDSEDFKEILTNIYNETGIEPEIELDVMGEMTVTQFINHMFTTSIQK